MLKRTDLTLHYISDVLVAIINSGHTGYIKMTAQRNEVQGLYRVLFQSYVALLIDARVKTNRFKSS